MNKESTIIVDGKYIEYKLPRSAKIAYAKYKKLGHNVYMATDKRLNFAHVLLEKVEYEILLDGKYIKYSSKERASKSFLRYLKQGRIAFLTMNKKITEESAIKAFTCYLKNGRDAYFTINKKKVCNP